MLGQFGIKRRLWKGGDWKMDKPTLETLQTNFESEHNNGNDLNLVN
jgi:hypothetical protein